MRRSFRRSVAPFVALGLLACAGSNGRSPAARANGSATAHASHALASRDSTDAATPRDGEDFSLYDLPSVWHDQRGAEVRLPSLAGKTRVIAMVYTSCEATCPLIVADLKRIEASIPAARREDVGFVLVSLDPARDTPSRLAAWAAHVHLDPARWTLLGGDADAVREIAAALGIRYQAQGDAAFAHTNVITVLDPTGRPVHQQLGLGASRGTAAVVQRLLR